MTRTSSPPFSPPSVRTAGRLWIWLAPALVAAILFSANLFTIISKDIWWHLKTGEWIVQNGRVPTHDPFSATAGGRPWVDHEWLFQVAAFLVHRSLGTAGLVVMRGLAGALIGLILYGLMRSQGLGPVPAAALIIFSGITVRERLFVRPELFSLLFMALLLGVLERGRAGKRRAWPWALALGCLWANIHAACLMGLAVGMAYLAGTVAARFTGERPRDGGGQGVASLALTVAAFAAGTLINPSSYRLYEIPFRLYGIIEQPWARNLEWQRPPVAYFPAYYVLLALALAVALARTAAKKGPGLARFFPLAGTAVSSLLHVRNIGFFAVTAPLAFFRSDGTAPGSDAGTRPSRHALVLLAAAVVAMALVCLRDPLRAPGFGINALLYPVKEVNFIIDHDLHGPLFNEVGHGGYVIYRLAGRIKPFIDGRNELYPDLLEEIHHALSDTRLFANLLERYHVRLALVRYQPELTKVTYEKNGTPVRALRAFSAVYFHRSRWALVYWDDVAMVFLKRDSADPAVSAFIARHEYKAIQPEDWRYVLARVEQHQLARDDVVAEIRRKLEEDPASARARFLLHTFAPTPDMTKNVHD